jgi:hypothetical protein
MGLRLTLLLLVVASAAVLVAEDRSLAHTEEFQRLVGGLGFGPALDLSGCAFGFDPRLDGGCAEECGPVPGGASFCPHHAGSVFSYPPLSVEEADETPP